jgi:hypothetical protein
MIYIIISNIGLALMMLIIYFRYSHFRITSTFKIRDLEKRLNREITDKESISTSLTGEVKTEVEQVKQLLHAIDKMRKEKEEEARLRLEAEKQIELALQKTQEIQKRMADWKTVQDAAMQDAKNAILQVGGDLFTKLSQNHKTETAESRSVIEQTVKSVYGYLDNISKNVESFKQKSDQVSAKLDRAVSSAGSTMVRAAEVAGSGAVADSVTQKILIEVIKNIKISGHEVNKKYFAVETLDAPKAKIMLADLVFFKDDILYIFDFKSIHYFQEYDKAKTANKDSAADVLKKKLNKYIAYISNPKYSEAICKIGAALKIKFTGSKAVFVVNSKDDIKTLKEIKYFELAQKAGLEIYNLDEVNDLIL